MSQRVAADQFAIANDRWGAADVGHWTRSRTAGLTDNIR